MKTYLAGELRFVARRLLRSPGFTAAATLTLALGIGANTAIFSLINTALLRPLPFAQPDRLVVLWERQRAQGKEREPVSAENFLDWRRGARTFSELAAWKSWGFALSGAGEPEELPAIRASANLFRLLQAVPALGRGLLAEDETPGRDRVAILSHALWARRFGSDPATVGRSILLDGEPYTVVGVMPAGFRFPNDPTVAVWTPLGFSPQERVSRGERQFNVLGRLAPGVTLEQAQVELDLIARGLAAAHPASNSGWGVTLVPAIEAASGGSRRPLLLLLGTVGLVLLIACANVGHLFLARAADRERELAVRVALGAAPSRLLRLLLLESGVVALLGSVAGIVLAVWTVPVIQALDPGMLPGWREARLDGRVLLFTAALLLLTTLACGLLPALQLLRLELRSPLAEAGSRLSAGVRRSRLRQGLIVGEVAAPQPQPAPAGRSRLRARPGARGHDLPLGSARGQCPRGRLLH
jgi:putative ABC transport system permease protein